MTDDYYNRRDGSPGSIGSQGDHPPRLPNLLRDRPLPSPSSSIHSRSMHQIQLEMEYDVEESGSSGDPSRARHWPGTLSGHAASGPDDATEQTTREIHALCVFDDIPPLSHNLPRSRLTDALAGLPVHRRWGRWRWREPPMLSNIHVLEAVMMYERGIEQGTQRRCNNCRAGQGISPQCVVAPESLREGLDTGPCSNCLYEGQSHTCNASGRRTPVSAAAKRPFEPMEDPEKVIDHMAVLEMIAQLKRPPGAPRDHSLLGRARRIEKAALHISQAAREWGDKMSKQA
ncbi:hypothetical protein B0I35DRAFT_211539 [Stachybotrys elegans]|uniref:Uncharacterized protein n=1 Tax=Stachybotrys elegans TaxID=80388 RepID=A0A8K0SYV3_9HYPO|nr:hypothetical protein B0I35DRAFT_211539 [Stachybotrys elegans]